MTDLQDPVQQDHRKPAPARAGAGVLFRSGAALALASFGVLVAATAGTASRDQPPLGFSGGFGEEPCTACHFEAEVNTGPGGVVVSAPERWTPGRTYDLAVTLTRPGVKVGGFELTARFEEGGAQAGALAPQAADEGKIAVSTSYAIQYAHHMHAGTNVVQRDTARWTVRWTAPATGGAVLFNVAANASDEDGSQFGDYIFTDTAKALPPGL